MADETKLPVRQDQNAVADTRSTAPAPPALILRGGNSARFAWDEFFASIDNANTKAAYQTACERFLDACATRGLTLQTVKPSDVRAHIDTLKNVKPKQDGEALAKPSKKLHLAAIRGLFDFLVTRHAVMLNPALSVRGPKYSVTEGRTPAFTVKQAREVVAAIDTGSAVGLRDRAIIAVLIYTACRVGAVAKLRVKDYRSDGTQRMLRFDEKGGKHREIPVRHDLETILNEYLATVGAGTAESAAPFFRSARGRSGKLASKPMTRTDIFRMVKRRVRDAGLPASRFTPHSFRSTTATDLLNQGADIEDVQFLLGHSDIRTTRFYDRRQKAVTRNLVERISI